MVDNMKKNKLNNIKCEHCNSQSTSLSEEESKELLTQLATHWVINEKGHLFCSYKFDNFIQAMSFANHVGEVAEELGHHPNMMITWGICDISIWTHKIEGLTKSDFILASHIDKISLKRK